MIRRSASDVAAWASLAGQVAEAIRKPTASTVALEKACARAQKAVLPCEPYSPDNPWMTLLREARSFAGQLATSRLDLASSLETAFAVAQSHCGFETKPGGMNAIDAEPANPGRSRWWDDRD